MELEKLSDDRNSSASNALGGDKYDREYTFRAISKGQTTLEVGVQSAPPEKNRQVQQEVSIRVN